MRKLGKLTQVVFTTALLICCIPLIAFGAEQMDNYPNAIGEVVYLLGTVTAEQPDGTVRELDLNRQVIPKDVIVTGSRSNVEIIFKDDSVFSQGEKARISLDDFVYSTNASASKLLFKMGQGTFRYVTGKIVQQNPDAFALETPSTTIGIRGTEIFAKIEEALERIGNLALSAGHTMTVGGRDLDQAGTAVNVDPATGAVSAPEPVSAEEAQEIVKAAPQTSQGEVGSSNDDPDDMSRRADALESQADRSKSNLDSDRPDYGSLHTISLQEDGQRGAERDADKAEEAQASSEGGGGGY